MPRKPPEQQLVVNKDRLMKHVAAIHMSGELGLLGRKMVNVLLLNAYDELLTKRTHTLPVVHLRAMLGWDDSANVDALRDALTLLATTPVEFNVMEDGAGKGGDDWKVMSMISFGEIKNGVCTYRYDEYLAERLYDPEVYATISISMQRRFDGGYAFALYENCARYRDVGSTGWWELGRFRKIVGATRAMYDEFKYLKRDVIVKPVGEINEVSDIRLVPEYRKTGRRVVAIRFLITESPQQSLLKPEIMDNYAGLRESDTFKRLREHGIGERLALAWLAEDEQRAKEVVAYVEERDRKKEVKNTTAGYIRTLMEDPAAAVGKKSEYEANKQAQAREEQERKKVEELAKARADFEENFKRHSVTASVNALTPAERVAYIRRYEAEKQKTVEYDSETGQVMAGLERVSFLGWLRPQFVPRTDTPEFEEWLRKQQEGKG